MPITDFEKYAAFTSNNPNLEVDFKPLNFDTLLKNNAFRVTHQGLEGGKYNPDPNAGFSLVSAYNDALKGGTELWKNNPAAYDVVRNMFLTNPQNIGAHKYLQILESAKDLGIPEEQIYYQPKRRNIIEQQINKLK